MSLIKFNKEQKMIRDEFRKFAVSEIEPIIEDIEKKGEFPQKIVDNLAELGLLGLIIPEEFGGVELDMTSLCIAVEEISKISASLGTILVVNNCLSAYSLMKYGTGNCKENYLGKLAGGEIGGYVCEPDIILPEEENDLRQEDGKTIFTGLREMVLNGDGAGFLILPISTEDQTKYYLLDSSAKGIYLKHQNVLGLRTAGFASVQFTDVELPEEACFIPNDISGKVQSDIQNVMNIGFSAVSLGIAQAALETAIKYSKERVQFDHRISEYPAVREMLAEMKLKIEATRLLVYDAAAGFDSQTDYSIQSKITRYHAAETGFFCGLNGIQVHGGYGYMKDYPLERYFRDAKVLQLLETTPRLIRSQIAKELLK
jgi:hypothetical protein